MKNKYEKTILDSLYLIEDNFKIRKGKNRLSYDELFEVMLNLQDLIEEYINQDWQECVKIIKTRYVPTINFMLRLDNNRKVEYLKQLENAYRIGARQDFECFLIYYEWENEDKLYEKRYNILNSYVYYLNVMAHDKNFETIIANLPSGYGKTRIVKLFEAWRFGLDPTGTVLSLCSNDSVVKGGSRSVIDIIKDERYSNIFPNLSYKTYGKELFLKETDGEWKLKDCSMLASYYASTTKSNVVGERANLHLHIDDLYGDPSEALDDKLNEYYYNKFVTVWRKRFVQSKTPQIIISGTMWSPTDFIVRVIALLKKENKFYKHPKFKYTYISENRKNVIIKVPALDPVTDTSTCEELRSTTSLRKERATMDSYLWETNFQQNPVPPEGLEFDWKNLKLYEEQPQNPYGYAYAVIDGTRKSGRDFFAMPIYQKYFEDYAMIDCIFTKIATSELIPDIVDKIITHHITKLVIESNVDGGLKKVIEDELKKQNVYYCVIVEKYNTVPKKVRIEANKGIILRKIWFPSKEIIEFNSDMYKYMRNLTSYNFGGRNSNDDAPDSASMFAGEIIQEKAKAPKVVAFKRLF